ncbi:UDP-glucose dehydrogenase family protein [Parageobacillus thermoglucosidasius]|uniref:UDP-glucose dehydrogenase family protein n=1 Tax=Parageobacillus thermoglucosidasius TaxID=1426 RepID=UPI00025B8198|nr:UDP-glucose/GDP-mannose dehydrogenase family protein [Parageobacillus thermoglucosidasius]EID44070.1 UDP-glucose 6-dehydrogenase [Parageobacillus thermoglucosidasius TNO-09.020]OAO83667.1 UDP-glucose dehydrogenase [Parageobacillus thermoglucosidasius]REK52829.1 MAG: UDP-glucose/GDP-mannose dehydrogenase family protein [Geobacillus sp.]
MNIAMIGAGYVGTATSVAFAEYGHKVYVIERDGEKLKKLKMSVLPFFEEGMEELFKKHSANGNLLFFHYIEEVIDQCEILMITVGTPSLPNGEADLSYVEEAARQIGRSMNEYKAIVIKSTVPVGTGDKINKIIKTELKKRNKEISFDLISNPEFLREGKALQDALHPERIVIGCETEKARQVMKELYSGINSPILFTTVKDAEMIKYASNAFLATKISFINELARLCDKVGANVIQVAKGMGLDSRIGPQFLQAGIGFGGSCFPKDVKALLALASAEKTPLQILQAVLDVNETQAQWFMEKVKKALGSLSRKRIAVLGLTFKPQTDDIREASSLKIIHYLLQNNACITAYDPQGTEHVKKIYPAINYAKTTLEALNGADAALIVTEWKEIIEIDWKKAKSILSQPFVFDGRNCLDASVMLELGYHYEGVGTPSLDERINGSF